jgi:NitT/TauT family transport system permease protein
VTPLLRSGSRVLYPAAGLLAMLLIWHLLAVTGTVPSYLLPAPGRVAAALWASAADGTLARHLAPTLQATALGYLAGSTLAVALAALVAEFRTVERFLYLHLVAVQSIPKVSVAPLVFLWAGFDVAGKVILVALICFFPVFANALAGFRAADPNLLDLLRAAGASRAHAFFEVKIPAAASQLFAGLEVAVAFALIGCVVMEFVGSTRGMGFVIQDSSNTFDLPLTFAAVVVLGLIGVVGNLLVRLVRRRVVFWDAEPAPTAIRGAAAGA